MNSASTLVNSADAEQTAIVAVVMGSDSDLPTLEPAVKVLNSFDIKSEVRVLSAHRTPFEMIDFASRAESKSFKVIIAGAGGAAHLPGMIASITTLPVIGVPIKSKALSGVDSLHSIVQMPKGIPVATVAIGGGENAGLLAAEILALYSPQIKEKLSIYRKNMHEDIIKKDNNLKAIGASKYLGELKISQD